MLLLASAVATGLFGVGLLIAPGLLVSLYGLRLDGDGALVARLLAAQLLGFMVLDFTSRAATGASLRTVLVAGLVAEVVSVVVVTGAAATGAGNALLCGVAALFGAFAVWRVLVLRALRS
jgi:hypothetical protein